MDNFTKIAKELAKQLDLPAESISVESRLVEDLHADSLDLIVVTMRLEELFGVKIPEEDILGVHTVSDIVQYIDGHEAK